MRYDMVKKDIKYTRHHELQKLNIIEETRLLCLRHPVQDVTIVDIATACKMTRATLYRYFESKEDILWAIFYRYLTTLNTALNDAIEKATTTYERFVALSEVFIHQYDTSEEFYLYSELFQNYYLKASSLSSYQSDNAYNVDHIKPGDLVHRLLQDFHDGSVNPSLDAKRTCVTFIYNCNSIVHCGFQNEQALPIKYGMEASEFVRHSMDVQLAYLKKSS